MGQISLQALLDQSTAPPGFYTGGSRDMPALQDLDRAKSTSYQVHYLRLKHTLVSLHLRLSPWTEVCRSAAS